MDQTEPAYKKELREELEQLSASQVLSPAYQKRKLLMWFIRNAITALVCWYFWDKPWIKWVLWIGIPLALISLLLILLGPFLLRKKMERLNRTIN